MLVRITIEWSSKYTQPNRDHYHQTQQNHKDDDGSGKRPSVSQPSAKAFVLHLLQSSESDGKWMGCLAVHIVHNGICWYGMLGMSMKSTMYQKLTKEKFYILLHTKIEYVFFKR